MKKIVKTLAVTIAMRTLDAKGVRRVRTSFKHLANWDVDSHIRSMSHHLDDVPGVYVLQTTSDLRIFFKMDADTITIVDIANKAAIRSFGQNAGEGT